MAWRAVEADDAWRWTGPDFAVALAPPPSPPHGARLLLRLYFPETQIQKLGPMTLTAFVDGQPLAPETYDKGGSYDFVRDVPACFLDTNVLPITFSFDPYLAQIGDRRTRPGGGGVDGGLGGRSRNARFFMKTVMVTGGAGFFGGILKRAILESGDRCISVDVVSRSRRTSQSRQAPDRLAGSGGLGPGICKRSPSTVWCTAPPCWRTARKIPKNCGPATWMEPAI